MEKITMLWCVIAALEKIDIWFVVFWLQEKKRKNYLSNVGGVLQNTVSKSVAYQ